MVRACRRLRIATAVSHLLHPGIIWAVGVFSMALRDVEPVLAALIMGLILTTISVAAACVGLASQIRRSPRALWGMTVTRQERLRAALMASLLTGVLLCGLLVVAFTPNAVHLTLLLITALQILIYSYILTRWVKMSAHVTAISALTVILIITFGRAIFVLAPAIPLSAWSRVNLSAHTRTETIIGFLVGSVVSGFTFCVGI